MYCSKFDILPVSCWFTKFIGTLLKKFYVFENENADLLTPFVKATCILLGLGVFKSKETRLFERNENIFTLNNHFMYLFYISLLVFLLHHESHEINGKLAAVEYVPAMRTCPQAKNIQNGSHGYTNFHENNGASLKLILLVLFAVYLVAKWDRCLWYDCHAMPPASGKPKR